VGLPATPLPEPRASVAPRRAWAEPLPGPGRAPSQE
jgi:hypothetical protein